MLGYSRNYAPYVVFYFVTNGTEFWVVFFKLGASPFILKDLVISPPPPPYLGGEETNNRHTYSTLRQTGRQFLVKKRSRGNIKIYLTLEPQQGE